MTSHRRFQNAPQAVRAARKFATRELAAYPSELVEVVELLVSELAGNCVRHTDSSFEVRISADRRRIRVTVSDGDPGKPVVQRVGTNALTGRGLALVEMLSSSWGVRAKRFLAAGKAVWFVLELDGGPDCAPLVA